METSLRRWFRRAQLARKPLFCQARGSGNEKSWLEYLWMIGMIEFFGGGATDEIKNSRLPDLLLRKQKARDPFGRGLNKSVGFKPQAFWAFIQAMASGRFSVPS